MNINRLLVPVAFSTVLAACPPVDPIIGGGPDPVDGLWRMRIISAGAHGNCGMMDASELHDLDLGMTLDTRDGTLVRFRIEGLELKGETDGGWVHATGRMVPDVVVTESIDDSEVDVDSGSEQTEELGGGFRSEDADMGRPTGPALYASLDADTRSAHSMQGELVIEYDTRDLQCTLALEFRASHVDHGGDVEDPTTVAPKPEAVEVEVEVEEGRTEED